MDRKPQKNLIKDNIIENIGNHGIYIKGATDTVIEYNEILVNSNSHGIYLEPGLRTLVKGNDIEGGCEGISVRSGSNGSIFEGNYIHKCSNGIIIRDSASITATDNEFYQVTPPVVYLMGDCPNARIFDNEMLLHEK